MQKLLLIDDDEQLAPLLAQYFSRFNFALESAAHPQVGLEMLGSGDYALLILDLMLPDMDGFEVCREVRKQSDLPIMMLTARGDVMDRIVGLELGADDYLAKPFEPRELVVRVQNILKRVTPAADTATEKTTTFEHISHDALRQQILIDDNTLDITHNEYLLLSLLMSKPGKIFSRDDILHHLKGNEMEIFSRSVDIAISRIRQKVKPLECIKTHRGAGYSFIPPRS